MLQMRKGEHHHSPVGPAMKQPLAASEDRIQRAGQTRRSAFANRVNPAWMLPVLARLRPGRGVVSKDAVSVCQLLPRGLGEVSALRLVEGTLELAEAAASEPPERLG
jgi:hypothetical protein